MNRARNLLRRRQAVAAMEDKTDMVTSDSVEPSALSLRTTDRTSSPVEQHPFAATARRRLSRFSTQRTEGSTSTLEKEKADSITRSMTKKWFGVEEIGPSDLPPSASSGTRYVRSWLERQPPLPSPRSSDSEGRPDQMLNQNRGSESPGPQPNVLGLSLQAWRSVMLVCLVLLVVDLGLMIPMLSRSVFAFQRQPSHPSTLCAFREKFFKVLIFDDNMQRYHTDFEKGLRDAASVFRVNITIERSHEIAEAVRSINEAQESLYDGIMISASDDNEHRESLKLAQEETPVMVLGSLESYEGIGMNTVSHVGEREADVGRLAGQTMKDAGMKTALCLSHADNMDSVHRCNGFKEAFGKQTYDLNLKSMMQSELKSKLIPIILDDREINGLFVADSRSFGLVHQILKSLNRLCTNKRPNQNARCIFFGAYGTDHKTLQVLRKRELQFTIDPQEYLRGYMATALMTLRSLGYVPPTTTPPASAFLLSRVVQSSKEAAHLLSADPCRPLSGKSQVLKFKVSLLGNKSGDSVRELKRGLRNAARDLNVDVRFHHYVEPSEGSFQDALDKSDDIDGVAISIEGFSNIPYTRQQELLSQTGKPLITYGTYQPSIYKSLSVLHVGHRQSEMLNTKSDWEDASVVLDENPALQGYLSVLFLVLDSTCGQMPSGLFNTAVYGLQQMLSESPVFESVCDSE